MSTNQIEFAHYGSKYKETPYDTAEIIGKSANIVIGKAANVKINDELEIHEGANLDIQGQVGI